MVDQVSGLLSPWLRRARIKVAIPYCRDSILDVGCGAGVLAEAIKPENYVGFDLDTEILELAHRLHPQHCFVSQMEKIPQSQRFDTVVSLAVIEHLKKPHEFLAELGLRLKPGGKIVLTTPHPGFEWIHTIGAWAGLFSAAAAAEHQHCFGGREIYRLAQTVSLKVVLYRRFLFGANQLIIMER